MKIWQILTTRLKKYEHLANFEKESEKLKKNLVKFEKKTKKVWQSCKFWEGDKPTCSPTPLPPFWPGPISSQEASRKFCQIFILFSSYARGIFRIFQNITLFLSLSQISWPQFVMIFKRTSGYPDVCCSYVGLKNQLPKNKKSIQAWHFRFNGSKMVL